MFVPGVVLGLVALTAATPATAGADTDVAALGLNQRVSVDATSPFYAGYADTGVGQATTSANFVVPWFTCGATDTGIATTLYAISRSGKFLAGADLFMYCEDGTFTLDGHITTSGGQIPIWQDLEPGDEVRMEIVPRAEGPSTHDISFTNVTHGWTSTLPTNSKIKRIEIAHRRMSLDGTRLEPPAYGTFTFTDVYFDDLPLKDAHAKRTSLVDDDGGVLIHASKAHQSSFRLVSKVAP